MTIDAATKAFHDDGAEEQFLRLECLRIAGQAWPGRSERELLDKAEQLLVWVITGNGDEDEDEWEELPRAKDDSGRRFRNRRTGHVEVRSHGIGSS